MVDHAAQIVAYIEAQTTYEGNHYPAALSVDGVGEAESTGKFWVIEVDAPTAPMFSDAAIFDIVCKHSTLTNLETMRKAICGLGSKAATAYIPTDATYPYYLEFWVDKPAYTPNDNYLILKCEARWAL